MMDVIKSISPTEWIQLAVLLISLMALIISILAYRRAGKTQAVTKITTETHSKPNSGIQKPILERYKSAEVSLMLTAQRNAQHQLRLVLKNTGIVAARDIDLIIGDPIRVIKNEEVVNGVSDHIEINDPALKPRLTVIDSRASFPISEILPGVVFDIFAVTTMGFGKICDFPISISWLDDRGMRHFQDEVVTI